MDNPVRIQYSEDKSLVYVIIRPENLPEGKLEPEWLLEALLETDFSSFQFQMDQKVFDELIHMRWQYQEQEVVRCLARRIEFRLETHISENQMQAWVSIYPVYPDENIDRERLLERLAYAGIRTGYIETALEQILVNGSAEQLLIAQGKWPEAGKDASVQALWQTQSRRPASGELICQVEAGDALLRYFPPTPGKDGFTVSGEILPAPRGRELVLVKSSGSDFSDSDAHLLVATRSGCPVLRFNSVRIDPLLILEQIAQPESVIDYEGCVLVLGSIENGCQVKVQGHLEILGDVCGAVLDVGGDLWVHGKIHKGSQIRVSGEIRARAIESSFIECQRHLLVKNEVLHSHLRCGGRAEVGQFTGGHLIALESIHVERLGSKNEIPCQLQLGLDDWFLDRQEFLNQEIQDLQQELEAAVKQLIQLRTKTADLFYAEVQQRKIAFLENKMAQMRDELAYIEQNWMSWPEGKEILITQQMYPPCEIRIGLLKHRVSHRSPGPLRLAVREFGSRKAILEEMLEATPSTSIQI